MSDQQSYFEMREHNDSLKRGHARLMSDYITEQRRANRYRDEAHLLTKERDAAVAEAERLRPVYAAAEYLDIAYSTDVVTEEDAAALLSQLRDAVRVCQEATRNALGGNAPIPTDTSTLPE